MCYFPIIVFWNLSNVLDYLTQWITNRLVLSVLYFLVSINLTYPKIYINQSFHFHCEYGYLMGLLIVSFYRMHLFYFYFFHKYWLESHQIYSGVVKELLADRQKWFKKSFCMLRGLDFLLGNFRLDLLTICDVYSVLRF